MLRLSGQDRMNSWSHGRVALLGDAGYCPSSLSGTGIDLAVVRAYVVAGELARAGGDHDTVFAVVSGALCQVQVGGNRGFRPWRCDRCRAQRVPRVDALRR